MNCSFKSLLAAVLLLCSTVATAHDFQIGGIFYNITSSTEKTVSVTFRGYSFDTYSNEYTGDVTVPSTVAYNGNTYSVTRIGNEAFRSCSGLTSIEIPGSVTSIGGSAFLGCSGLTSIEIPGSVTSIGVGAFSSCYGLTSIEIPGSVTSIGNGAFFGCSGLTSIVVAEENTVYDSRNNCNAIIETATNTLIQGCKNTIIPGSVTSIGNGAFYLCTGLTSIEIPNSVTSIGEGAFAGCSGLTSVTSLATTAPALGSYAFDRISSGATLYYPAGSDYSSWEQYFANTEEITEEEEVFGDLNGDGTVSVSDIQVLVNIILGN